MAVKDEEDDDLNKFMLSRESKRQSLSEGFSTKEEEEYEMSANSLRYEGERYETVYADKAIQTDEDQVIILRALHQKDLISAQIQTSSPRKEVDRL
jgi:hypothetical protein